MPRLTIRKNWILDGIRIGLIIAGLVLLGSRLSIDSADAQAENNTPNPAEKYIVLAWNDLGMHCYNRDFKDLAVLPPFNTLWAQVIRVDNPPQVITTGITVEFFFENNTYSVGKSNFWTYDVELFNDDLPDNVGLTGTGLFGDMTLAGDHFEAVGIPLTEFNDGDHITPYPYQLATVVVRQQGTNLELARAKVVAPVSTEMHCDYCHYDRGPGNEDIATGVIEQNLLTKHDEENSGKYPAGSGLLMNRRPILCAECHASNALSLPGVPGIPNLSHAMHEKHNERVPDTLNGCYSCHPGPQTKCLRDVMSLSPYNLDCIDCHGTMFTVANKPNPWLNEPRCDNVACHGSGFQQDQPLYRMSKQHGGVYCEGCHDSTHAVAASREPSDWIKFDALQGSHGTLKKCTVCHLTWPSQPGPHNLSFQLRSMYLPVVLR